MNKCHKKLKDITLPIDEDLFYDMLQKKIKSSKYVRKTVDT